MLQVAVPCFHGQRLSGTEPLHDLGQVVLGEVEEHGDGLKLRNGGHAVGVVGMDDVALVDQAQAEPPCERREDPAVGKLQFDVLDDAFVGFDGAFKLMDVGGLRFELLARNDALGGKHLVPALVDAGIFQLRGVACQLSFGLDELRLEGAGVDLGQQVVLLDQLSFGKSHAHQLAVDAAADDNRVVRGRRTEAREVNAELAAARGGGHYRHGSAALLRGRCVSLSGRLGSALPLRIITISGYAHSRQNQQPKPSMAFSRLGSGAGPGRSVWWRLGSRSKIASHGALV
jgi:hypothetical protein